jgi:MFS transporter, DHA2 family, multidrug resistance protein
MTAFLPLIRTGAAPLAPVGLIGARRILAIASVLAAMAAAVLDAASVNVALPSIAQSLRLTPQHVIWVATAYQAALVMGLLPLAAIGERYGYRPTFIAGLSVFVGCGAVCTLAPNFAWLVGARFLQGFGAAAIMALGVALLRQVVKPAELGLAIGWNAMTVAFFTAAGPSLGASIVAMGDWHLLFAASLPLGLAAICGSSALPSVRESSKPFDSASLLLYCATVATFIAAAALANSRLTLSIGCLVCGLAIATTLLHRERVRGFPFLPADLLRNKSFAASIGASIGCFIGQGLGLLALPFALHLRLGTSVLETGVLMTPWPLAVLLITPITARLLGRVSSGRLCAMGGLCLSIGLGGLAIIPLHAGIPPHLMSVIACGLGFGLFQTPNNRNMFLSAPINRSASAGGLQGTARLAGQTIGGLTFTFILGLLPIAAATRTGFAIAALSTLAAGAISLRCSRESS